MRAAQKIVLSGIQPTGIPHLGNYLGALREWSALSKQEGRHFYSLMDLHAITAQRDPEALRRDIFDGACTLLACGIEPVKGKCSLFVQSNVKQHAEMYWILQCISKVAEMQRMTQFKDKASQARAEFDMGLLTYPILMAADIAVYRATHVPVGEDQVQHLELTRYLVDTFNRLYSPNAPYLIRPQTVLKHDTKRVMSLCDPSKKMSKSEPRPESRILMTDTPDEIKKKVSRATTDSLGIIAWDMLDNRPGILNLISIAAACDNTDEIEMRKACNGMNMVQLKARVTDAVVRNVEPIRNKVDAFRKDREHVLKTLKEGAEEASEAAESTMVQVRELVGFLKLG